MNYKILLLEDMQIYLKILKEKLLDQNTTKYFRVYRKFYE